MVRAVFDKHDTVLLGISVDNAATLKAWTQDMGTVWFPVLSDFWPHGQVTARYGLLRSDGVAQGALIFIDKQGIIRDITVYDNEVLPRVEDLIKKDRPLHYSLLSAVVFLPVPAIKILALRLLRV